MSGFKSPVPCRIVSVESAAACRERLALSAEQRNFEESLDRSLREQARLAELEDYEAADAMSVEVETMKREMALRSGKLRDLCVEVDRAEREVGGRRAEQRRAVEGVVAWLEAFERETRDALAAQTRDADAKHQ